MTGLSLAHESGCGDCCACADESVGGMFEYSGPFTFLVYSCDAYALAFGVVMSAACLVGCGVMVPAMCMMALHGKLVGSL